MHSIRLTKDEEIRYNDDLLILDGHNSREKPLSIYFLKLFRLLIYKMDIEQRYVIAFLHRNNKSVEDISEILKDTYHNEYYHIDAIRYWLRRIKCG